MTLAYDPHSSTLYNAETGVAVAILLDDIPAAERHALGRLFAAAEGMLSALKMAKVELRPRQTFVDMHSHDVDYVRGKIDAALRATEPPA